MKLRKKSLIIAITAMMVLILTACGGSSKDLSQADVEKITAGTTDKELEEKLGKPSKKITDEKEAAKLVEKDSQGIAKIAMSGETKKMEAFYGEGSQEEMGNMLTEAATAKEMAVYQYKYKDEDKKEQTKNFYVAGDKVILTNFD